MQKMHLGKHAVLQVCVLPCVVCVHVWVRDVVHAKNVSIHAEDESE
jgi:hypothetical protein